MGSEAAGPQLTRWLLDTRTLWVGLKIKDAAPQLLQLLPLDEQQIPLRKYHFADACMSLGSALLKRAYIAKCTGLKWSEIKFGRKLDDKLGKPYWLPPNTSQKWPQIDFNLSHQHGIVTLVGVVSKNGDQEVEAAVDVVSTTERNDLGTVANSDLTKFVSTFEHVLSDEEIFSITYKLPSEGSIRLLSGEEIPNDQLGRVDRTIECGTTLTAQLKDGRTVDFPSELIIEEKIRTFYATFSLKEAYTKLGGLGLSAEWIKDCIFMDVKAPSKGGVPRCNIQGIWGEKLTEDQIDFQLEGHSVHNLLIEQQSFEENYIITTMFKPFKRSAQQNIPEWVNIHLEDILP